MSLKKAIKIATYKTLHGARVLIAVHVVNLDHSQTIVFVSEECAGMIPTTRKEHHWVAGDVQLWQIMFEVECIFGELAMRMA